jgi:Uma2 family endonuclease
MMATATAGSRKRAMTSSGIVFHDVTWDDYEAMLKIVGDRAIRVTYDQGEMEIFMPSYGHNDDAFLLGRMVDLLTEELEIPYRGGDTTTHKREDLDKGAEPDKCYWFGRNARHMAGKRQLDLSRDPAPDLIIEVDVTRTSLDRLQIFAAMKVPEVWRSTSRALQFLHLQEDGTYQPRPTSRNFPALTVSSVAQFLKEGRTADSTDWIRSFRAFVREKIVPARRPKGR